MHHHKKQDNKTKQKQSGRAAVDLSLHFLFKVTSVIFFHTLELCTLKKESLSEFVIF